MIKPTLISECKTDAEKIRLWRDLLKTEDMTVKSAVTMVREDTLGDWIPGEDSSGSYFTIPSFQRDYSYSSKQKTALIESILLNIPIGSILVYQETQEDGTRTLPVIDGQHRLKTIYDYVNDRFKLNGKHLNFLTSLEGKKFSDLDPEFKHTIYDYTLTVLKARNTGEDITETIEEFSNQCFIRMNENPNTMSPYTLLKAKYSSPFFTEYDHMLNIIFRRDKDLRDTFSTATRGQNERYKLEITAVLSVLQYGLHSKFRDIKSIAEIMILSVNHLDELQTEKHVEHLEKEIVQFALFLKKFGRYGVEQPLTHQILGSEERHSVNLKKGILIRMALVYFHLSNQSKTVHLSEKLFQVIQNTFRIAYQDDASLKYNNLKEFETIFANLYKDEIGPIEIAEEVQV